jgi:hypothetical protein
MPVRSGSPERSGEGVEGVGEDHHHRGDGQDKSAMAGCGAEAEAERPEYDAEQG